MADNNFIKDTVLTVSENNGVECKKKSKLNFEVNWGSFFTFMAYWGITVFIIVFLIIMIYVMQEKDNIIDEVIRSTDTLNLFFTLSLSAFLEISWNMEKDNKLYKVCFTFELINVFIGVIIYFAYSIPGMDSFICNECKTLNIHNKLLGMKDIINVGYVIWSSIIVVLCFFARSIRAK